MKINEVLNPTSGIFSHMPQDIWGSDLDPSFMDVEVFTSMGGLTASPLFLHYVHDGVLDHDGLARLIHQHYGKNWKRLWDALKAEYDIMITTSTDEKRTSSREHTDTERRDLTGTKSSVVNGSDTGTSSQVRSGAITNADTATTEYGSANTRANNLSTTTTNSGTDTTTDTFNETTVGDSSVTKSGSEKHATSSTQTRNLAGGENGSVTTDKNTTDKGTVSHQKGTTDAGSITTNTSLHQGGTNTDVTANGIYGVGGSGLVNEKAQTETTNRDLTDTTNTTESRDLRGSENNTETRNLATTGHDVETRALKTTDTGTVSDQGSDTLSFDSRKDTTASQDKHTGTVSHATAHGLTTNTSDTGTTTDTHSGSDTQRGSSTQTFDNLTDTLTRNLTSESNTTEQSTDGGTIQGQGKESFTETFHAEGSSPLRTYQALVKEEVEIRSGGGWNFTELVINDVRRLIALTIWERRNPIV